MEKKGPAQVLKSFLVTEAKRKHVRRRARFQQHGDARYHQVFFFLQVNAPKVIHDILTETLGEHAPSNVTLKNWVAQFKCGDFSTCDAPRPGRPKTVTNPEIIDQIHELILEYRRISAKSIAEQAKDLSAPPRKITDERSARFSAQEIQVSVKITPFLFMTL